MHPKFPFRCRSSTVLSFPANSLLVSSVVSVPVRARALAGVACVSVRYNNERSGGSTEYGLAGQPSSTPAPV